MRISARWTGPFDHSVGPLRQPSASLLFQEMMNPSFGFVAVGRCEAGMLLNVYFEGLKCCQSARPSPQKGRSTLLPGAWRG